MEDHLLKGASFVVGRGRRECVIVLQIQADGQTNAILSQFRMGRDNKWGVLRLLYEIGSHPTGTVGDWGVVRV